MPSRQDGNEEAEDMGEGTAPSEDVCETTASSKESGPEKQMQHDGQNAVEVSVARELQELHIKASERPPG